MSAYGFVRDYVNTAVYNELIDSVSNYINVLSILPLFITIIISAILVYLLSYKNKPYFSYVFKAHKKDRLHTSFYTGT